jgi:competence protein ComEC
LTLPPLPLFANAKEAVVGFGVLLLVFCLHVSIEYQHFLTFKSDQSVRVEGVLEDHYQKTSKHGKPYHVLKISSKNFTLYTVSWKEALHVRKNQQLTLYILSDSVGFADYLSRRFFAPSFSLHPVRKSKEGVRERLSHYIAMQHETLDMQSLFSALFLATPVSKSLRESVQYWGISHLIAISGFHLGVIMGLGYFLLRPVYRFFQSRYFPYRSAVTDLGLVMLGVVFGYLWLIEFVPSFLRAFVMAGLGFFFLVRHLRIISFVTLGLSVALILAVFPALLFSLGFWFSVIGVFYIFLYLHHFKDRFSAPLHAVFINVWVFLAMTIPVHYWFGLTSWQQWGAVPLSVVFVGFYPLSAVLHLVGWGGILDGFLEQLLALRLESADVATPLWGLIIYLTLSVLAIRFRYLALLVIALGALPFMGI